MRRDGTQGFTLLELLVAFAILALFVIPMLEIVHESRVRAFKYTRVREVQDLAQRKLFERIYYYSEETILAGELQEMSGNFAEEGRPTWDWEIPYPQPISQGEQVLLEYTINVYIPELGDEQIGGESMAGSSGSFGGAGSFGSYGSEDFGYGDDSLRGDSFRSDRFGDGTSGRQASFTMSTWTFPSEFWYDEQAELYEQGIDTGFYGFGGYDAYGGNGGY